MIHSAAFRLRSESEAASRLLLLVMLELVEYHADGSHHSEVDASGNGNEVRLAVGSKEFLGGDLTAGRGRR